MSAPGGSLLQHVYRARRVEGFVKLIVAGGLAMVAGLWLKALLVPGSTGWVLGVAVALIGIGSLGWGIWSQVDY